MAIPRTQSGNPPGRRTLLLGISSSNPSAALSNIVFVRLCMSLARQTLDLLPRPRDQRPTVAARQNPPRGSHGSRHLSHQRHPLRRLSLALTQQPSHPAPWPQALPVDRRLRELAWQPARRRRRPVERQEAGPEARLQRMPPAKAEMRRRPRPLHALLAMQEAKPHMSSLGQFQAHRQAQPSRRNGA
ncbi:hypothetical protein BKA81DRAFT_362951 [Phyllosticta paracitricarpa]